MARRAEGLSVKLWNQFFQRCFQERLSPGELSSLSHLMETKYPISGLGISKALLRRSFQQCKPVDPLLPLYLNTFLQSGTVNTHELLDGLSEILRSYEMSQDSQAITAKTFLFRVELQRCVIDAVLECISGFVKDFDDDSVIKIIRAIADWMTALVTQNQNAIHYSESQRVGDIMQDVMLARQSLALLVLTVASIQNFTDVLHSDLPPDLSRHLTTSLTSFIPILGIYSPDLAGRLDMLQKSYDALQFRDPEGFGSSESDTLALGTVQVNNVVDSEPMNTRGGFLIFLEALLTGRPFAPDPLIVGFLQTRHKGDVSMGMSELMTVTFDLLAMSSNKPDSKDRTFVIRSFLVTKVPIIAETLSALNFSSLDLEFIISQALNYVNTNIQLAMSRTLEPDQSVTPLSEVRKDFLSSCTLHGIVSESSIPQILGDASMQNVRSGVKIQRQSLTNEYKSNHQKAIEHILNGIEKADGNAATHVEALTEIIHGLCAGRDTMSLKAACSQLSRRIRALDLIALFVGVTNFVNPICRLLNAWKAEDDQGEHQPVYDEFGVCFLLLSVIVRRFGLSCSDLGFDHEPSFLRQVLQEGPVSQDVNSLYTQQNEQLSGWIRDLFENHGIRDELMSSCPPQDFYLLTPTIIHQIVTACSAGVLDGETLKSGFELLLEPILIPSLVLGIQWLADHLMEQQLNRDATCNVLQRLVAPGSIKKESVALHDTVLSIVKRPLTDALLSLDSHEPKRQDVKAILEKLRNHSDVSQHESSNLGGQHPIAGIRNSISVLCFWSSHAAIAAEPVSYSYQDLQNTVTKHGAVMTLEALAEEVKAQTTAGLGHIALDVVTTLIYASYVKQSSQSTSSPADLPTEPHSQSLSLREALQLAVEDAPRQILKDASKAETFIRLKSRVEMLIANAPPASSGLQMPTGDIMSGIDLNATIDLGTDTSTGLDFSEANADIPMNLDTALNDENEATQATGGSTMPSTEDDIFGDIKIDDQMMFDF